MATIAEARRLAKLVWPLWPMKSIIVECNKARASATVNNPGGLMAHEFEVFAPTRSAALAGLCAALREMAGEEKR